eukprot:CAMPEP_0181126696 /NCGR_PEP_ID=MMETSP1071-20121207/27779_1 /TAXON_ID=35127 /ORGANISM="Thalassiosira sp., Strain NH16" /LENGTH=582 /DNA_ID=CAMNT_0023212339 /DNA_START=166 /DNA_END=1914 /DNA_ORIENTATION=-
MAPPAKSVSSERAVADEGRSNDNDGSAIDQTDSLAVGEFVYQSLDPLDPRKVALNMFELYCHELITTPSVSRRAFLIDEMRYLIRRLIQHQYDYGRLFNRTCVANMVARVCARHAYEVPEETEGNGKSCIILDCLVDFPANKWKKVIVQFECLRGSMLRNDASLIVLPSKITDDKKGRSGGDESEELTPEPDEEVNEELESRTVFSKGYTKMLEWMKFLACLSHLQPQLERAIQKGSIEGAESVVIPHDNIIAFDSAIEEQFGDDEENKYASILSSLLEVNGNVSRPTRYGGRHLKSLAEIRQILSAHSREFDLGHFQDKFLQLIRRWTDLVLPVPELAKLNYGSTDDDGGDEKQTAVLDNKENIRAPAAEIGTKTPPKQHMREKRRDNRTAPPPATASFDNEVGDDIESSSDDETEGKRGAREVLKLKRKALMKDLEDPLDECVKIAQSARTQRKPENEGDASNQVGKEVKYQSFGREKKKKPKITSLKFDSDGSEDEAVGLSELPAQYKPAKMVHTIHVSRKYSTSRKRKRFTEQEDKAIKEGVDMFDVGRWSDIKAYFAMELKDRDTVQIKDRWRTLNK